MTYVLIADFAGKGKTTIHLTHTLFSLSFLHHFFSSSEFEFDPVIRRKASNGSDFRMQILYDFTTTIRVNWGFHSINKSTSPLPTTNQPKHSH